MNKKHKHCELIKQWADGAEIEFKLIANTDWWLSKSPPWENDAYEFRIKPEPKPDVAELLCIERGYGTVINIDGKCNLKVIWDGETDKLKSAEVLK